jgi:hypothetical protein
MDNVALFFFCFGVGSLVRLVWCIADIYCTLANYRFLLLFLLIRLY